MTINFNNLYLRFPEGKDYALENIDFTIKKRSCTVISGKSGCGKTTVTRCINGLIPNLYPADIEGSILIDGKETDHSHWEASPLCGCVFQDPRSQFFTTNTTSEVAFAMENYGVPSEEIKRRIDEVFTLLDIEHLRDKSVFSLSSGEKQKIAIASAIAMKPKILVFDEPSANLDFHSTLALGKLILKLKQLGHTIIIAEHRLHYLYDAADKLILINDGAICWEADHKRINTISTKELNSYGLRSINIEDIKKGSKSIPENKSIELYCNKISFGYKNEELLLNKISFKACGGEIIGLIGDNGTGKTTLTKVLCGLLKQIDGSILINGINTTPKERIKQSYFVMQDADYQLFSESVEQEVTLGREEAEENDQLVEKVLTQLSLEGLIKRHPGSLSGGQKQRLVIAAMLAHNKNILFLDEPTSGLDYCHMAMVAEAIHEQAVLGKLIFVITHDNELLNRVCTRIVKIQDGEISQDYKLTERSS